MFGFDTRHDKQWMALLSNSELVREIEKLAKPPTSAPKCDGACCSKKLRAARPPTVQPPTRWSNGMIETSVSAIAASGTDAVVFSLNLRGGARPIRVFAKNAGTEDITGSKLQLSADGSLWATLDSTTFSLGVIPDPDFPTYGYIYGRTGQLIRSATVVAHSPEGSLSRQAAELEVPHLVEDLRGIGALVEESAR